MNKEMFDGIIKANLVAKEGEASFGYKAEGKEAPYENYYSEEAFNDFVREMQEDFEDAYRAYGAGKGGELNAKNGRYGMVPPKMASIASSSRFCYLALRDNAQVFGAVGDVKFEHECRIKGIDGGIAPQLDAYIADKGIYVEAKCHEIFDTHKVILKEKYWNRVYGENNDFGFVPKIKPEMEQFEMALSDFGIDKKKTRFDLKQFLCHLMGIASQDQKTATLVYLFFKPKTDHVSAQEKIDLVFQELEDEIKVIFDSAPVRFFCEKNNIHLKAIYEEAYLMEKLDKNNMKLICEK